MSQDEELQRAIRQIEKGVRAGMREAARIIERNNRAMYKSTPPDQDKAKKSAQGAGEQF